MGFNSLQIPLYFHALLVGGETGRAPLENSPASTKAEHTSAL